MKKIILPCLLVLSLAACSGQKSEPKPTTPAPAQPQEASAPTATAPTPAPAEEVVVDESKKNLTPMDSIKSLDKEIEGYQLGQNLTPEQMESNRKLKQRIIRGTFDIKQLSMLSLDKHWEELQDEQRAHFVDLMTQLLETKAIFSKEQLRGENKLYTIQYNKEVIDPKDPNKATVFTRMLVPSKKMDLNLTYKLVKNDDIWKIYDVIVDDASLLSNYKFQFDRIIQKGGYADLIKRMEEKLTQIGSKA